MKIAVCFIYVLLSILYLSITTPYVRVAGGINLITQLGFISYLCYLAQQTKSINDTERLFFQYLCGLGVGNCIYILVCIIKGGYWSIHKIDAYAFILAAGFIVFLVHLALKKHDSSR